MPTAGSSTGADGGCHEGRRSRPLRRRQRGKRPQREIGAKGRDVLTRKPQCWRVVFRRWPKKSPEPDRGILVPTRAAAPHTTGPRQLSPVRLRDGAGHLRSQLAANVANGVGRRSSTILINRVCVETAVEFRSLIGGNRKCALVSRNAVPEIFDKLDALVHSQLLQLRFHGQSLVTRHTNRIRRRCPNATELFCWISRIWHTPHNAVSQP